MNPAPSRPNALPWVLLAVATVAVAFRAWTSFCFVPFTEWNDVRLAPTFMLWHGPNPYPGLDTGPLTTWTYGPVPLLLNLPALLANDVVTAIMIGGVITFLCAALPLAVVTGVLRPAATAPVFTDRLWVFLLCLALWPNSSLQYIQSDNAAVAFGLFSCWLLSSRENKFRPHALAALCAALAVWSKQTTLFLIPAQILWLALTAGPRIAVRYTLAAAASGFALAGIFIAWFGFDGLWVNLVELPRRFPYTSEPLERTRILWMALVGYAALPALGVWLGRRAIFRRDSPWLLPVLMWLFLLPTALLSTYGNGGSSNSLNNVLYLFPIAALSLVAWLRARQPLRTPALLTAGVVAVVLQQLSLSPLLPISPMTARLEIATDLARQHPGQIYFPWNPLVTFYAEHRFYHTEDGLIVRKVAGAPRSREALFRDLPPAWTLTAIPGWRDYYGEYRDLQPANAQLLFVDKWSVYTWKDPNVAGKSK